MYLQTLVVALPGPGMAQHPVAPADRLRWLQVRVLPTFPPPTFLYLPYLPTSYPPTSYYLPPGGAGALQAARADARRRFDRLGPR